MTTKMSFFDVLKKGVQNIENEVKKLKTLTEDGELVTEEQMMDYFMKAKKFETEVRQTYADMTQMQNEIKSSGNPLLASKTRIQELRQLLCDIEDNSGIRQFGYKPFTEGYSVDSLLIGAERHSSEDNNIEDFKESDIMKDDERYHNEDYGHQNSDRRLGDGDYNNAIKDPGHLNAYVQPETNYGQPSLNYRPNGKRNEYPNQCINPKQLAEEFPKKTNSSVDKTSGTVRFADIPDVSKPNTLHTYNPKNEEKSDEKITKKYDKLLTRTPKMQDFGITRRFTILPNAYNKPEANGRNDQYSTPEEPNYGSSHTSRFNYLNNGFNMASNLDPITPPNPDNSHAADSFVTVEFTPGLTTKRPKGISRINHDNDNAKNNQNRQYKKDDNNFQNHQKNWSEETQKQKLPQSVLKSKDNNREITPEQPIPLADAAKSAQMIETICGKSEGSGTPPMPKSRIDHNFHKQILKHL